jgi:hypothetical protein
LIVSLCPLDTLTENNLLEPQFAALKQRLVGCLCHEVLDLETPQRRRLARLAALNRLGETGRVIFSGFIPRLSCILTETSKHSGAGGAAAGDITDDREAARVARFFVGEFKLRFPQVSQQQRTIHLDGSDATLLEDAALILARALRGAHALFVKSFGESEISSILIFLSMKINLRFLHFLSKKRSWSGRCRPGTPTGRACGRWSRTRTQRVSS